MQYLRKVNCPSLQIEATFNDQAYALELFTKLKNLGYHDSEILDHFVEEDKEVETDETSFSFLMDKVIIQA